MRTLFGLLDHILSTPPFGNEQALAILNDEDAIVKAGENMDIELDSDQAIQIQEVGLNWVKQVQAGADQDSCRQQAKQALDG